MDQFISAFIKIFFQVTGLQIRIQIQLLDNNNEMTEFFIIGIEPSLISYNSIMSISDIISDIDNGKS